MTDSKKIEDGGPSDIVEFFREVKEEFQRVVGEYEKRREFLNTGPESKARFFTLRANEFCCSSRAFRKARNARDEAMNDTSELLSALKTVRANLVRLAWEENSLMIEGIDAAISKAEGRL